MSVTRSQSVSLFCIFIFFSSILYFAKNLHSSSLFTHICVGCTKINHSWPWSELNLQLYGIFPYTLCLFVSISEFWLIFMFFLATLFTSMSTILNVISIWSNINPRHILLLHSSSNTRHSKTNVSCSVAANLYAIFRFSYSIFFVRLSASVHQQQHRNKKTKKSRKKIEHFLLAAS